MHICSVVRCLKIEFLFNFIISCYNCIASNGQKHKLDAWQAAGTAWIRSRDIGDS